MAEGEGGGGEKFVVSFFFSRPFWPTGRSPASLQKKNGLARYKWEKKRGGKQRKRVSSYPALASKCMTAFSEQ